LTRADWPGGSKIVEPSHAGRPETIRALERAAFGRNRHREERSDAAIQRRPTETVISGLLRFARRWFDPNAICSTVKLNRGLAPVAARRRRDRRPQCANTGHSAAEPNGRVGPKRGHRDKPVAKECAGNTNRNVGDAMRLWKFGLPGASDREKVALNRMSLRRAQSGRP
jgi:hypothetical protein